MAVKAPAEGPWLPDERPAPAAAFRQCVGLLLEACGQPVALPGVHNMRAWMVPLIGVGMKLWLHVYEERAEDHSVVGCDACRIIGEQQIHHSASCRTLLPCLHEQAARPEDEHAQLKLDCSSRQCTSLVFVGRSSCAFCMPKTALRWCRYMGPLVLLSQQHLLTLSSTC